jgi:hypothetical protein
MLRLLQHPVALVLLCFSLAGTPVTYRGGASHPHPHMFLEFLMDAQAGAFDHHHYGEASEPEHAEHPAHEHDQSPVQEPSTPRVSDPSDRFGAALSAFVVGDVGQLASIVPQHALPQAELIERAFMPFAQPPPGVAISPIAPPPR